MHVKHLDRPKSIACDRANPKKGQKQKLIMKILVRYGHEKWQKLNSKVESTKKLYARLRVRL